VDRFATGTSIALTFSRMLRQACRGIRSQSGRRPVRARLKPPPANDKDLAGFPDRSGKQRGKAAVSINAGVMM